MQHILLTDIARCTGGIARIRNCSIRAVHTHKRAWVWAFVGCKHITKRKDTNWQVGLTANTSQQKGNRTSRAFIGCKHITTERIQNEYLVFDTTVDEDTTSSYTSEHNAKGYFRQMQTTRGRNSWQTIMLTKWQIRSNVHEQSHIARFEQAQHCNCYIPPQSSHAVMPTIPTSPYLPVQNKECLELMKMKQSESTDSLHWIKHVLKHVQHVSIVYNNNCVVFQYLDSNKDTTGARRAIILKQAFEPNIRNDRTTWTVRGTHSHHEQRAKNDKFRCDGTHSFFLMRTIGRR